jgi:protein-L-isoaspartate O-methyltransferase
MTNTDTGTWQPQLASLVAALVDAGALHTRAWIDAFSATPRHLFTPQVILSTAEGYRQLSGDDSADRDKWLSVVYSDDSLVTQHKPHAAGHTLPSGQPLQVPTSSSTMPSLMARMLETLDVHDEMRMLEIGTSTGCNAALLSDRRSGAKVVSIGLIDPDLVDQAQQRLAGLGHSPTLPVGDGAAGAADHGPYDRIIATAAVPEIPLAWIQQLTPKGKILANLRGDLTGATLCLLTKHDTDDEVIGPILPIGGHFMWLRPDVDDPHRPHEHPRPPARHVQPYHHLAGSHPCPHRRREIPLPATTSTPQSTLPAPRTGSRPEHPQRARRDHRHRGRRLTRRSLHPARPRGPAPGHPVWTPPDLAHRRSHPLPVRGPQPAQPGQVWCCRQ